MSTKGHTHKANCHSSSQRRAWAGGGVERRRIWVKGLRAPCEAPHATRSDVRKNVSCFPPPTPLLFSNNIRGPFSSPPTLLERTYIILTVQSSETGSYLRGRQHRQFVSRVQAPNQQFSKCPSQTSVSPPED